MAIIKKQFLVTLEVDTEKTKGWKNNKYDWATYPNWDINYGHKTGPLQFIKSCWREFKQTWRYKGLKCNIEEYPLEDKECLDCGGKTKKKDFQVIIADVIHYICEHCYIINGGIKK